MKCRDEDYEAVIEGAMLAGTHWFNMALHRMGLTEETDDALHAQYLTQAMRLKIALISKAMLDALDEIEDHRPRFVRGDLEGGAAGAARCRALLSVIRSIALSAKPYLELDGDQAL